jgi:DNA-binding beta-propeller fold protein YncE
VTQSQQSELGVGWAGCEDADADAGAIGQSGLTARAFVPLPNLPPGGKFSYDIGAVDAQEHRYYLADRTNKSLDILDTRTLALTQVPGFAGAGASNDVSGPDGVVIARDGLVFVGDVDSIKVVDPEAGVVVDTIPTATSGFRTDEGCSDPDHDLVMFQNPADSPPFATFVSTATRQIVATLTFADSSGLEACVYDRRTRRFFVNNDGTPGNPTGELDAIPVATVLAGAPSVASRYALGSCGPTGIALDHNQRLVVGCDEPAGDPQTTLVVDARDGAILSTVTQVGGEDEVAFDPHLDRFYVAARDMTADGISQTGLSNATFTPVLGIIDARTNAFLASIPIGKGSHSVAVDRKTGDVFVPMPPTATAAGGVQVYSPADCDLGRGGLRHPPR